MTENTLPAEAESPIKNCFVISPIGDRQAAYGSEERLRYEQAIEIWDYVIEPACKALGIGPVRADKIDEPGEITEQTFEHLRDDDLVIADLTGGNANVMYELGLRHTTGKLTVQIGEKERLPFDVTVIRTIQFVRTETGLIEARERLKRAISAGVESGSRPVTATRVWSEVDSSVMEIPEVTEPEEDDEGSGFLDMIAEAEEALPLLNKVTDGLSVTFEDLSAVATAAQEEVSKSDERGGGAGGRLRVAGEMAKNLEDPTARVEQLAADFVGELERVDPGISYLIERIEEEPDVREKEDTKQFMGSIGQLAQAAGPALAQVAELADIVQEAGNMSNRLRPVTRRMSSALRKISSGSETMQEWGRRIDDLA